MEWPLPWPRDFGELPAVASRRDEVQSQGWRVQGLVATGDERRVITYTRAPNQADGRFSAFVRSGDEDLPVRDLLLCTHGTRDVCCGSLGTQLALDLAGADLPADVRSWRTSHTGGHRFAPTFVVLPEATVWAFADVDLVQQVLRRQGDAADVVDRYRGCAGLGSPRVQALEREVLRRVGWSLLDWPRLGEEGAGGRVRLTVWRDGQAETWEAMVEPSRTRPVPDCGKPLEEAKKAETEWLVRDVALAA